MHNKVVYRLARGLRRAGLVALRFNFRGVGQSHGEHGYLEGEIEDARAALAWLRLRYPALPFALAGFSFGARVVARLGCETPGSRFMLLAGFPAEDAAADHLGSCTTPKIFLQSTHDQFGPRESMEPLFARAAEPKELIWIEAADHFFAGALEEVEEAMMRVAARF
jgi:alpha/beta superfamily hydrolase